MTFDNGFVLLIVNFVDKSDEQTSKSQNRQTGLSRTADLIKNSISWFISCCFLKGWKTLFRIIHTVLTAQVRILAFLS